MRSEVRDGRNIAYLCLQALNEGQASYAHVNGIVDGLRALGWRVVLFAPDSTTKPQAVHRIVAIIRAQIGCLRHLSRADLLYVRWHFAAWPTVALAKIRRVPLVVEVNGTFDDAVAAWPRLKPLAGLLRSASRAQLAWANGLIAVTDELASWAEAQCGSPKRTVVVPNAANTDLFAPSPTSRGNGGEYVAFVGALAPWQGVAVMIDATRHPRWPRGIVLAVAGDGQMRGRLLAVPGDRIRYLGRLRHAEVPGFLAGAIASLCVQTATGGRGNVGCSPIKLYEGLATGRPVIASDMPGVGDVVEAAGGGVVVPPGDAAAVADAVASLAADRDAADAMGARAREAAVKEHSWEARARDTEAFIQDVLSAR